MKSTVKIMKMLFKFRLNKHQLFSKYDGAFTRIPEIMFSLHSANFQVKTCEICFQKTDYALKQQIMTNHKKTKELYRRGYRLNLSHGLIQVRDTAYILLLRD
jgi:hypothetical protein